MKNLTIAKLSLITLVVILVISSCTKNPSNIKVIPENAHVVTVFNVPSLIKKGDLLNVANLETIKKARNNKQNLKIEEVKLVDRIFEKPLSIGLNYEKDWFSFYIKESSHEQYFCIAASVINEGSITNFIEESLNTTDAEFKIEEHGTYKSAITDKKTAIAWDKEKLLILNVEHLGKVDSDLKSKLDELFNLEKDKQLVNNTSFQEFYSNKKDISLWLTSNLFEEEKEFIKFEKEYGVNASNNYASFFLDFEEGEINLSSKFDGNENIQDLIINNKVLNDDFNSDLLEFIPADHLSLISLSINTEALYEQIKENRMVSIGNMSKVTPQEFLESMGGSIAFSVVGGTKSKKGLDNGNNKSSVILTFDLNEKETLEELISILPENSLEEKNGYYEVTAGRSLNQTIYLANNNSSCVITNDEKLIIKYKNNDVILNNLSSTSMSSEIDDNSLYVNVNLDEEKLTDDIKNVIERNQTTSEKELMNVLKQISESIDLKLSNKNTAKLRLKVNNKEENSLKVIIQTLDENYERFKNINVY